MKRNSNVVSLDVDLRANFCFLFRYAWWRTVSSSQWKISSQQLQNKCLVSQKCKVTVEGQEDTATNRLH